MKDEPKHLLSEHMRPRQLQDLLLPRRDLDRLQRMVDSGSISNLAFYGDPGAGKTSAARILMRGFHDIGSLDVDCSAGISVDYIRSGIAGFARSVAFCEGYKLCFLDEVDYISKNAQAALRKVIEDYSDNCRFLLAANDITKLTPAIRSRILEICFDIPPTDRDDAEARLIDRYTRTLSELGIPFDQARLIELIGIYFPDLRSIANQVEYEFAL
jgi:DNA polymerase III delta prime subunit